MAHEVTPWKEGALSISVRTDAISKREKHSQEINEAYGEGGGLNANYRTVEAVAIVANALGSGGLTYGVDFVFKTGGDAVLFDFLDESTQETAKRLIRTLLI